MGERTGIGWTGSTWNPLRARHLVTGRIGWACVRVSPGCLHCYAATQNEAAHRYGTGEDYTAPALDRVVPYLDLKAVALPLSWRAPRRIFVCSMTDLFAEWVPDEWIDRVFAVMALAPQHTFQVLTKRPERMRKFCVDAGTRHLIAAAIRRYFPRETRAFVDVLPTLDDGTGWPLPNVWLGVSVEDQAAADKRIPLLLQTPAAVRWVSYEPALGPVSFCEWLPATEAAFKLNGYRMARGAAKNAGLPTLDWIIYGAESGPGRRSHDLAWLRSVYEQTRAAGVPLFVKQGSAFRPGQQADIQDELWVQEFPHVA